MPTSSAQQSVPATLIPGDGIGPEISAAVVEILDALGKPFKWDTQEGGMAAAPKSGDPLPAALLDSIRGTKLALKGPLTTPSAAASAPSTSGYAKSSSSTRTCVQHAR